MGNERSGANATARLIKMITSAFLLLFYLIQVYDRVDFDAAPGPETSKVILSPNAMLALRSLGCNLAGAHVWI